LFRLAAFDGFFLAFFTFFLAGCVTGFSALAIR
jgi:hypothetical protein